MNVSRALVSLLALLVVPLHAASDSTAPDPLELFREAARRVDAAAALSVHVEKRFDVVATDGAKLQHGGALDVLLRRRAGLLRRSRPGLRVDYGDDLSAKELWYDGSKMTLVDHIKNVYVTMPFEGKVGEMLLDARARYSLEMPLAPLIEARLSREFEENVRSSRYVGVHDVEGSPCHHLLFRGEGTDLQVWIETGPEPLLRKLVATYNDIEAAPQQTLVFSEWDFDAAADDEEFVAVLPGGAVEVGFLPAPVAEGDQ